MKNLLIKAAAIMATIAALLTGCGSSGDAPPPMTKAATTVYLFGVMSSSSKVATLHTELTVPAGIMVNYSSPPGATTGKFPLKTGAITPSGTTKVAQSDISAEYNIADRKLTIDYINTPDFISQLRKNIKSSTVGNGFEIATINFKLAVADSLPTLPAPWQDLNVSVYEETSTLNILSTSGLKLNFITSYQP